MKLYHAVKHLFITTSLLMLFYNTHAQRIRKDHREMTPSEKSAYLVAINQMFANGVITDMANHHAGHFNTEIHTTTNPINGTQFLPWHRVFQLEFEQKLRAVGTANAQYLTVPYWDWRVENTPASVTWDDPDFLSLSNISNWGVTRLLGGGFVVASSSDVVSLLALNGPILPTIWESTSTTSSFFSKGLEEWHNLGHRFVGGTMRFSPAAPLDPVFFLHHGFVDKLWQDWEDRDNAIQSVFNYNSLIHFTSINPNTIIDSRFTRYQDDNNNIFETDVWYAYNKKLLLDGLNGDFNVLAGADKLYCYTAWNGSSVEGAIYVGDVMRDASDNVVPDTKGGFTIKDGSQCNFSSGKEIYFFPGVSVEQGAVFMASIVGTPCGFSSNNFVSSSSTESINNEDALPNSNSITKAFPNPFKGNLNIRFSLSQPSYVSVRVLDGFGKPVYLPIMNKQLGTGIYTLHWQPATNLSSGIYYCIIQTNSSKEVVKLIYNK